MTSHPVVFLFSESALDSEYLKREMGDILADCLVEVSQKKPWDPIEFIAMWLYKYRTNTVMRERVRKKLHFLSEKGNYVIK